MVTHEGLPCSYLCSFKEMEYTEPRQTGRLFTPVKLVNKIGTSCASLTYYIMIQRRCECGVHWACSVFKILSERSKKNLWVWHNSVMDSIVPLRKLELNIEMNWRLWSDIIFAFCEVYMPSQMQFYWHPVSQSSIEKYIDAWCSHNCQFPACQYIVWTTRTASWSHNGWWHDGSSPNYHPSHSVTWHETSFSMSILV